jgi:flagellar biosynthesis/type III secretory pathway M-ring protein FliF/YscJ
MVPEVSDPVELAKLKEVVAMAAGINPGRGDAIVVYNHVPVDNRTEAPPDPSDQIDTPTPVQDSRSAGHAQRFAPPVSYLVIALALVATLAAVLVLRMRRLVGQSESQLTPSQREQLLREIARWAAKEKT